LAALAQTVLFKNAPKFCLFIYLFFPRDFFVEENKEYSKIFWNILFLKMESSNLIN